MCICMLPVTTIYAETISEKKNVTLDTMQYNVQLTITGDAGKPFEADLEMPDGTVHRHDEYDGSKVMYLEVGESERRWLINEAPAGTYALLITGEKQAYQTGIKQELRKPDTKWISPANTALEPGGSPLQLQWTTDGDYDENDSMRVFLKPAGGWLQMMIGEFPLGSGNAVISLPDTIVDGTYELQLLADNKTPEGQMIDPKVTIHLSRSIEQSELQIVKAVPEGEHVAIELQMPDVLHWISLAGRFEDQSGKITESEASIDDLVELERLPDNPDLRRFIWVMPLSEGKYSGQLQLVYSNYTMSGPLHVPDFELKVRDWSKDKLEWSIESEKTNAEHLQVKLTLQDAARVQIVDSGSGILYDAEVPATKPGAEDSVISVPLEEGDRFVRVILQDGGGALTEYEKRFQVDRTPPSLTMIQPQSTHARLDGGMASGFIDTDSVVLFKGKEIKPDAAGYFNITGVGKSLKITVRDSHGNETSYAWEEQSGWSKAFITFVILNILLVALTIAIIFFIRRKAKG